MPTEALSTMATTLPVRLSPRDVLSGIGQRFGVSSMQIAQWNNIKNPDLFSIDQRLTI